MEEVMESINDKGGYRAARAAKNGKAETTSDEMLNLSNSTSNSIPHASYEGNKF